MPNSTPNKPPSPRSRRRWLRWLFVIGIAASLGYGGYKVWRFLEEAQMSLGLDRTPGLGIDGLLVNQGTWQAPSDSLLRIAQVHMVLRIVEACDSLDREHASQEQERAALAKIMNEHMIERSMYTWSRTTVWRALTTRPVTPADSANTALLRLLRSRFLQPRNRRVLTDSLDRLILVPA